MKPRCIESVVVRGCSPSLPHHSNEQITTIHILVDGMLRSAVTRDGVFPPHQINMIAEGVCQGLIDVGDYSPNGAAFVLEITRRGKKHTDDFSKVGHETTGTGRPQTTAYWDSRSTKAPAVRPSELAVPTYARCGTEDALVARTMQLLIETDQADVSACGAVPQRSTSSTCADRGRGSAGCVRSARLLR